MIALLLLVLVSSASGFVSGSNKLSTQGLAKASSHVPVSTSQSSLSMTLSLHDQRQRQGRRGAERRYANYPSRALDFSNHHRPRRQSSLAYKPQVERVVSLINEERERYGEDLLHLNHNLCVAAKKAARIVKREGSIDYHARNGKSSLKQRIQAAGYEDIDPDTYECAGWQSLYTETYIAGSNDVQLMVDSLLDGSFREELLSSTFDEVGICVEKDLMVITLGTIYFEEKVPFTPEQQREYADEVFYLTNLERTDHGLAPLKRNTLLDEAAFEHARDMYERDFYSHDSPEGESAGDRIERTGYFDVDKRGARRWQTGVAENIAKGQQSPAQVVRDWMESKEHRENILAPEMLELGVGVYGEHWVQNLGRVFVKYD